MKRCPGCSQTLPLTSFNKGNEKGGVQAYCRGCSRPRSLAVYNKRKAVNPDGVPAAEHATCSECGETKPGTEFFRRRFNSPSGLTPYCKKCERVITAAVKYKITRAEARDLLTTGVACVICGSTRKLVIDHCHDSGRVRGVICHLCNIGIGHFRNNAEWLESAAAYLRT